MRKAACLMLVLAFIPLAGCLGGDDPFFDSYFYCEYGGVTWQYRYHDTYVEEKELVYGFEDEGFVLTYIHHTNGFGLGHFDLKFLNTTTNETDPNGVLSITVNDIEMTPGGFGRDGKNLYITNLTISFHYRTEAEANFTGSDSYDETDELSRELYEMDIALNVERVEIIEEIMIRIIGSEPDSSYVGRYYIVEES